MSADAVPISSAPAAIIWPAILMRGCTDRRSSHSPSATMMDDPMMMLIGMRTHCSIAPRRRIPIMQRREAADRESRQPAEEDRHAPKVGNRRFVQLARRIGAVDDAVVNSDATASPA